MATQRHSVTPHLIEYLLRRVKSGYIAFRELLRPFVWDLTKVRSLLNSSYQDYPAGNLISRRNPTIRHRGG